MPISEHIFEVRYKPNPKVLDHRGTWAEALARYLDLSKWQIVENRVDVFDAENHSRCFVSFVNAGYVMQDASTDAEFRDQALKFFAYVLKFTNFSNPLLVNRLGVRARYLTPFDGTFQDLFRRYTERYFGLTAVAAKTVGGELVDIGGALNFKDQYGHFNTTTGPMLQEQSKDFFQGRKELPGVGLYYEIDYWKRPERELKDAAILQLIETFANEGSKRHERIRKLLFGD